MTNFCDALIITGVIFITTGVGGSLGLKIPKLGYIGGPVGIVLFVFGLSLKIIGGC